MYECHITILDNIDIKESVEKLGWKYSRIAGDPILGRDTYSYATAHFHKDKPSTQVLSTMNEVVALLSGEGATILRKKIEFIIYDSRLHATQP